MSLECGECERDLRGPHDPSCSHYKPPARCRICSEKLVEDDFGLYCPTHGASTAEAAPYAALSQHLHGDGDNPTAGSRLIVSAAEAVVVAWRARALDAEAEVERLRAVANDLNGIVEGLDGTMTYGTWRAERTGSRLKDTKEWMSFYTALVRMEYAKRDDRLDRMAPSDLRILLGDTFRLLAEIERLRTENERLRYVLDGVAGAIDTGRNEPLHIWRGQIDIARAALAEGGPDDR